MTKADELSTLDVAIEQLGEDSYLGPWLRQVRDSVTSDIRSDIFPTITIAACQDACAASLAEARKAAEEIVAAAQAKARSIEESADKHRESAAAAIRSAMRAIENW